MRESCPLRPNNPYSSSKAAADLLGVQCALGYGMNVIVVRPFNHAGPRQTPNYVLSGLARQVAEVEMGRKPRVEVGNLEVTRDFTDVRDVVRGYRLLVEKGVSGEIYNLGSGRGVKLADALELLRGLFDRLSTSLRRSRAFAPSINRCSSPIRRNCRPRPLGTRRSPSSKP